MKIIVCIKQVPESATTEVDPALYTINRNKSKAVINPFDLHAIECALTFKDKFPKTEITALCMGPKTAESSLREALSLGIDKAILISDKILGGSDSLATAITLSTAIKKLKFDLIICGQQSIDGDTAQVGPEIASLLNISQSTKVISLEKITQKKVTLIRKIGQVKETLEFDYPLLMTVGREINNPRLITFNNLQKAKNQKIKKFDAKRLKLKKSETGLLGSPTKVTKIFPCAKKADTVFLKGSLKSQAKRIIEEIV